MVSENNKNLQSKNDEDIDLALDVRGILTEKGNQHEYVLVWFHEDPKTIGATYIRRIDDFIGSKQDKPIDHYPTKRVINNEAEYPPAQVIAVAGWRKFSFFYAPY
ncbi:hypothetical protein QAD02_000036 [Eretmocerus hayati]|uniref:Uncharacterized protein n=1 Tax=Eretmocerus hayati TaxID=131215 RepID=A0ACC2NCA2_9HYME|nr:hypothetical protein QAD02_000036 [Eretmocerus hayati]